MAAAGRTAVGVGRSQPLSIGAGSERQHHAEPVREQLEKRISELWSSGSDVDGPRHTVVESARAVGQTQLSLWLMRQGIRLYWSGIRHPQTQGKVERFHGSLQRAWERRGVPGQNLQAWLDDYRWEHNHVRPHEALEMKTPASCGSRVANVTIRIRRAGNIRLEHGC